MPPSGQGALASLLGCVVNTNPPDIRRNAVPVFKLVTGLFGV